MLSAYYSKPNDKCMLQKQSVEMNHCMLKSMEMSMLLVHSSRGAS